uniref:Uncharacterized protein n=1 Tax=Anguilla anguilla TaxID=7936 RepID=A0A0E9P761_ANGAN
MFLGVTVLLQQAFGFETKKRIRCQSADCQL